jgi:hypothetical protein
MGGYYDQSKPSNDPWHFAHPPRRRSYFDGAPFDDMDYDDGVIRPQRQAWSERAIRMFNVLIK